MIDEKKLIEALWKRHREVQVIDRNYVHEEVEIICNEICNVVCIIDEQPKTDWIPYTTNGELPYNGQKVWLSFSNEICSYVKQAWWIYDHFEWDNGKRVKDYPLAWMTYVVPQPYKKVGADNEL